MDQQRARTATSTHRVLYVITDTDVGGAERFLQRLATALPHPYQPAVLSIMPVGQVGRELQQAGVPVSSLQVQSPRQLLKLGRAARLVTRMRPAIIHGILCHGNLLARCLGRLFSLPVVCSVRVAERGAYWQRVAEQLGARFSDRVTAVSPSVAKFLRRLGVPNSRVTVIPNSVPLESIRRVPPADLTPLAVPRGAKVLLFVGRLHRQKGLDVLLQAVALLGRTDVVLIVIGNGPMGPYAQLADRLGISPQLRWLGFQPSVAAYMKAAYCLVLPSRWEGMPNVLLEAMAAGTACVATAVDGSVDLLRESQAGLLVPPNDPQRLAHALRRLLEHERLREELVLRGQKFVEGFTLEKEVGAYVEIYETVLRSRGAPC